MRPTLATAFRIYSAAIDTNTIIIWKTFFFQSYILGGVNNFPPIKKKPTKLLDDKTDPSVSDKNQRGVITAAAVDICHNTKMIVSFRGLQAQTGHLCVSVCVVCVCLQKIVVLLCLCHPEWHVKLRVNNSCPLARSKNSVAFSSGLAQKCPQLE